MNGILVLDKPAGMSSASAVDHVKKAMKARRAGHGGTLDPIATGVLVICLDEATKVASYLLSDDKEYIAELVLGTDTDTLDRSGQIVGTRPHEHVTRELLCAALANHLGEHDQLPPMFSAIKQGGVRLYRQARSGIEVERTPRRVRIDRLELTAFDGLRATITIACGKGTYVRSLVSELGNELGCGAYLAELRRTRSGVFSIDQAQRLDALDPARIVRYQSALRLPVIVTPDALVMKVRSGLQLPIALLPGLAPELGQVQLVDERGDLVAIAHAAAGKAIYDRVFIAETLEM